MEQYLQDLLTALAVVINGIPQGLLALSYGFAAFPTAVAFLIGIGGSLAFNSVATISFQAETITLAGNLGSTIRERLSLVFWGGFLLLIPSLLGLNEAIVRFIGPVVVFSMMAGVGIMLANVSFTLLKDEYITGNHITCQCTDSLVYQERPCFDNNNFSNSFNSSLYCHQICSFF